MTFTPRLATFTQDLDVESQSGVMVAELSLAHEVRPLRREGAKGPKGQITKYSGVFSILDILEWSQKGMLGQKWKCLGGKAFFFDSSENCTLAIFI